MRMWSAVAVVLVLVTMCLTAHAIDTGDAFDDPELQARYEHISAEVRCLKCQNQSIKDSNAILAADLRREIRRMLGEGMSDAEIYDFLVERYGDFVLYRPRASGKTLVFWIAPVLLLLGGAFLLIQILRRRMALPIDADDESVEGST